MLHHWKRYWLWITLLFLGIVLLVWLFIQEAVTTEVFLGVLAASLTLFITLVGYFRENDQFLKQLFTEFNRRYEKMNNFLNQLKEDDVLDEVKKQKGDRLSQSLRGGIYVGSERGTFV
ncbi:MAG TPA: hypothetical protein VEB86_00390 [Chryseosolibacter sp.]|nr:hypothetical protein [Chryseosolibacter sp.]